MKKKICLLLIIVICFFFLFFFFINKDQDKEKSNNKKELEIMNISFESRADKLSEDYGFYQLYGWLQVQGTNIDLPLISPTFYEEPKFNFGWISVDSFFRKTRKVMIGHNVINVSKEPIVNNLVSTNFEDLMSFVYYDFAKDNMYIMFSHNGEDKLYVIYSVGFFYSDYDDAEGLDNPDDITNYIKMVRDNSIYDYDIDVDSSDDIITIKTCTRMFGLNGKTQFQIDARKVRDNEKTYKYNVSKTKLFDELELKDSYKKNDEEI